MLAVGDRVSHRFEPLHRYGIGRVIRLDGHMFDGQQMVVVQWFKNHRPFEHHHPDALQLELED